MWKNPQLVNIEVCSNYDIRVRMWVGWGMLGIHFQIGNEINNVHFFNKSSNVVIDGFTFMHAS